MTETAASRWSALSQYHSRYLRTAIDCSQLTIPSLIPESDMYEGSSGMSDNQLPSLYQGSGARNLNGLSAKLLLALYPPSQPFFRLVIHEGKLKEYMADQAAAGRQEEEVKSRMDMALASVERDILKKLDELQARPALFELIKKLICGGNGLI